MISITGVHCRLCAPSRKAPRHLPPARNIRVAIWPHRTARPRTAVGQFGNDGQHRSGGGIASRSSTRGRSAYAKCMPRSPPVTTSAQVRNVKAAILKTAMRLTRSCRAVSGTFPPGYQREIADHRLKQIRVSRSPLAAGASGCARFMAATCGYSRPMRAEGSECRPIRLHPCRAQTTWHCRPRRTGESERLQPHGRSATEPPTAPN